MVKPPRALPAPASTPVVVGTLGTPAEGQALIALMASNIAAGFLPVANDPSAEAVAEFSVQVALAIINRLQPEPTT